MMLWSRYLFVVLTLGLSTGGYAAVVFDQSSRLYNYQSAGGVPISENASDAGSDGRAPGFSAVGLPPTTNQFRSFISFSAVVRTDGPPPISAPTGTSNNLPDGPVAIVLSDARVGSPYVSRNVSVYFSGVIPLPETDETGLLLSELAPPLTPEQYWSPIPHIPGGFASTETNNYTEQVGFYYSPHSGKIYASQAGPVEVTWRTLQGTATKPSDFEANPEKYLEENSYYYRLMTSSYVVSGSPPPGTPIRTLYWTEKSFSTLGVPISVSSAGVGDLVFAYNAAVPKTVSEAYRAASDSNPGAGSGFSALEERRTVWWDSVQSLLLAYNREGRIMLEILGDITSGDDRQHLGIEVIDLKKRPRPLDVTTFLGDQLLPPEGESLSILSPRVVNTGSGNQGEQLLHRQVLLGSGGNALFAIRPTVGQNDCLVHWLETGFGGLQWPRLLGRYQLQWPSEAWRYNHFLRPLVSSAVDAANTAVKLDANDVPRIAYQDPLDQIRGFLTGDNRFYTFLSREHPAHRTLLQFNSGDEVSFQRVFSWLGESLQSNAFSSDDTPDAVATSLVEWNGLTKTFDWSSEMFVPRILTSSVEVGKRISPPEGELGQATYSAGHIYTGEDGSLNLYDVHAYKDPLTEGFETANQGAIIPVNAIPGRDMLEVWWFRESSSQVGYNSGSTSGEFSQIYWPSVIGRYDLRWPTDAREIVLASNDGSGPLGNILAKGSLYVQNDPDADGFNPNEEHALIQGGQVYALRDDLNITRLEGYSSEPYVLLEYTDLDDRPSLEVFRVLREKLAGGSTFNFRVAAGSLLQPPMPLPLMEKPFVSTPQGLRSANTEYAAAKVTASRNDGPATTLTVDKSLGAQADSLRLVLQDTNFDEQKLFIVTDIPSEVELRGAFVRPETASGLTDPIRGETNEVSLVEIERSALEDNFFQITWQIDALLTVQAYMTARLDTVIGQPLEPGDDLYFRNPTSGRGRAVTLTVLEYDFSTKVAKLQWQASKRLSVTRKTSPFQNPIVQQSDIEVQNAVVEVTGNLDAQFVEFGTDNGDIVYFPDSAFSAEDNAFAGWSIGRELPLYSSGDLVAEASYTIQDRKGDLWVYRGPHGGADDTAHFSIRYYYRTLPGFYFPSETYVDQPPVGTITPYLRSVDAGGVYIGAEYYGANEEPEQAMPVDYLPYWPDTAPILQMAQTLTLPQGGLPAVRGQSSVEVLYQQSQARTNGPRSVVLHDPTRIKSFDLGNPSSSDRLAKVPASVQITTQRGKTYFPVLPPHLSERFYLDPNISDNGALVLKGEFRDEVFGDDYLLLNVLGEKDRETLKALCSVEDPDFTLWSSAIDNLSTTYEQFAESPLAPGTFVPVAFLNQGAYELTEVWDDDVAVDSYALTATGSGTGFVTLITGNGQAFTPEDEPVGMHVLRVAPTLYTGAVKPILSSNPLAEKVTMQQVVDLAGQTGDYGFEWLIASPVDGAPPAVYQTDGEIALAAGSPWSHIPFPLERDLAGSLGSTDASRVRPVSGSVAAINVIPFTSAVLSGEDWVFSGLELNHGLLAGQRVLVKGMTNGVPESTASEFGTILTSDVSSVRVVLDNGVDLLATNFTPVAGGLEEAIESPLQVQSWLYRSLDPIAGSFSELWISLDMDAGLGAEVFIGSERVVVANSPRANDTASVSNPGYLTPLSKLYRIDPAVVSRNPGADLSVALFSSGPAGTPQTFDLQLEVSRELDMTSTSNKWLPLAPEQYVDGVRAVIGEAADVRALSDSYVIMRYRAVTPEHASYQPDGGWSRWTTPALSEGWIKRVLAGINPFNQRLTDLFNNQVNTDVSILTQAGARYEGDVALNLENINDFGLIEIYETVLKRGKSLSVDAGINYGPANDALLLAAGYLNDLYLMLGNEAYADAANPTIGIGTADNTYGDIATAAFSFKGQVPSLLEEELALLRGRDDFLQPGVELSPVYNRLVWNYTRGIDSGEAIYAVNYNIQENPDRDPDGIVNAEDAARMFPMGHGDAYGHYLTAIKGYYSLLNSDDFDWVPRIEAVNVLGVPVAVDYFDERKFASAATSLARAGRQILDLTWRKDYQPVSKAGWSHLSQKRVNSSSRQIPSTRYWGVDSWASRVSQGAYVNWVVGNAIIPSEDPDPTHEGIQKVDRTTVPELKELALILQGVQNALDNAEAGLSPLLGIPEDAMAFDLDPNYIVGADGGSTHFEQIYDRATHALQNAVVAFDDAKDVTRLMRSEQDSLSDLQNRVVEQELAYRNRLIEIYGTPYPDDMGPGKTWVQDYTGPDLIHYMYVESPELPFKGLWNYPGAIEEADWEISLADLPSDWGTNIDITGRDVAEDPNYSENPTVTFHVGPHGYLEKPSNWRSQRASPGRIQEAIGAELAARNRLYHAVYAQTATKASLDRLILLFNEEIVNYEKRRNLEAGLLASKTLLEAAVVANDIYQLFADNLKQDIKETQNVSQEALPRSALIGLAAGGDLTSVGRSAIEAAGYAITKTLDKTTFLRQAAIKGLELSQANIERYTQFENIDTLTRETEQRAALVAIGDFFEGMQEQLWGINLLLLEYEDAQRKVRSVIAEGDRLQEEREIFRKRSAALVQGYRTRDAAFRVFRNEKLERYKTLFDLASRYALLAANAYDYETGLLGTSAGRAFVQRIIASRALGIVEDGQPQFAGSNTGDPGLSSALAEMKADWDVLRDRLGISSPDAYGTLVSLRRELFRILPGSDGDTNWRQILEQSKRRDLLEDADVRRLAMQISNGDGLPVPGLVLEFGTTIADGYNLFGKPLSAYDHAFSSSSFATKIFGAGVALIGYQGMDNPDGNEDAVSGAGANSPPDPDLAFLDPDALSATPYIYLIPVGIDSMRSPPLNDSSAIRSWNVKDVAIPLPFNIGAWEPEALQAAHSSDTLTESLFTTRKHQAFRPVSDTAFFSDELYGDLGTLNRSQYMNNRLVGRSVWNSKWKLVIPGKTLLSNAEEGLQRFIANVEDIKIHFVTYSYSGN
ncbi:MAG: hypothetical protein RI897_1350 [Verrucomicrobiota bacterium]